MDVEGGVAQEPGHLQAAARLAFQHAAVHIVPYSVLLRASSMLCIDYARISELARKTRIWAMVMMPRRVLPAALECATPQEAARGTHPSNKAAPTSARFTTRGAAAVSPACCTASRAASHNIVW